jgi:hypothetical protein
MCHLFGSSRIINSMTALAASGGLGEAASWVSLRQDIYVALTLNKPLNVRLRNFEASQSLCEPDDDTWANKMVLTFATILSFTSDDGQELEPERWDAFQHDTDSWMISKPDTFAPVIEIDCDPLGSRPFPEIWMLKPAHVIGWQYFHMAKIILAGSDPRKPKHGFARLRAFKDTEVRESVSRGKAL